MLFPQIDVGAFLLEENLTLDQIDEKEAIKEKLIGCKTGEIDQWITAIMVNHLPLRTISPKTSNVPERKAVDFP